MSVSVLGEMLMKGSTLSVLCLFQSVLSTCSRPAECFESRGPSKSVEYGAYEARLLCEMLLKGSVVILEVRSVETCRFSVKC